MAKIRINGDTSGYIEISAPAVAGSTSITLPATTGGSLLATDASGNLNVDSGTFYIDGTNNRVGIGTTSPTVPLEVSATGAGIKNIINVKPGISTTGEGGAITFSNLDPASNQLAKIAAVFEGGTFSGSLRFYTNTDTEGASPSEKMRITPAGRVGIGTISPGAGLHISTTGQTTSALDTSSNLNLLVSDTGTSAGNGGSIVFGFNTGAGKFAAIKGQVITGAGNSIGDLAFSTRNATGDSTLTERLRITYDGKVGIGTNATSPNQQLHVRTDQAAYTWTRIDNQSSSASAYAGLQLGAFGNTWGLAIGSSAANSNSLTFVLDAGGTNSEKMRLDTSGRLLVGTSTAPLYGSLQVYKSGENISSFVADSGFVPIFAWNKTTGSGTFIEFGTGTSYTIRGSITYNSGTGQTSYNLVSDYRAKSLLGNVENSGEIIDALKVYRGLMNGATIERPMLVAHETQEVAPYCVTGEKDAVDNEGNPVYQQMDHQVLVPLLIAEIQQLRARVAALENA